MREIKYRAFDKIAGKIYDVGYIDFANEVVQVAMIKNGICYAAYISPLKDVELMQYTGLKDKNGKEIYEGGIIRNDRGTILKVPFVDGAFYAEGTDALSKQYVFSVLSDFSSWSEVIGNIYENPELLEESK